MFKVIRQRFRDARTLKALCFGAERHANDRGQQQPGAEHFVLAALDLPDGTAQQAFARMQRDPAAFVRAIEAQYRSALEAVGLDVEPADSLLDAVPPVPTSSGPYRSQPSAGNLMQVLTREIMVAEQKRDATTPLLGAHVLMAAAVAQFGICARALREMGVEPSGLSAAARETIESMRGPGHNAAR